MFRAFDAERERLVAVKLFKLDLPPHRVHQLVAAFEQLIAADLTHPALAMPLATGITGVSAYLAQEYVAAESMDLAVREYGPAPPADALRVAAQLAGALDFGAVVNVHHGGLHPRDVLLSADETRITGAGVTRAIEGVGVAAPVRRPYTAPERMAGAEWGRRADIYSLAALVHELLWGRRISGTGSHVADALTEIPGSRLPALKDAFARALAQDPNDRFETALEFAEAIKSAFPDLSLVDAAPPPGRRAAAPALREEPRLPLDDEPPIAAPLPASSAAEPVADLADLDVRSTGDQELELHAIDLRAAEQARYQDVESAPSIPESSLADASPRHAAAPIAQPPPVEIARHTSSVVEPPVISTIEEPRSTMWPLVATLAIGLAIGFAGGYGVGTRERASAPAVASPTAAPSATPLDASVPPERTSPVAAAPGREATEVAVAERQKAAPPPPPAVTPPAQEKAASRSSRRVSPPPRPPAAPTTPSRRSAARDASRPVRPLPPPASTAASGTAGRFVGGLTVDSKPTGARVFLDGRLIGTTPLAVPGVSAGSHAIRLELDGYRRWSSAIRVVASEQNRVTASLER